MSWAIETKAYGSRIWRQAGAPHATEGEAQAALCGHPRAHRTRLHNTMTGEVVSLPCGPKCAQCWPTTGMRGAPHPGCSHRTYRTPHVGAPPTGHHM